MFKRIILAFIVLLIAGNTGRAQVNFVDLGLSVDWASCNIGANAPEEAGWFFSWGEVSPKSDYSVERHKYAVQHRVGDFLWKYDSQYQNILEPEDDAATVILGPGCHTPTPRECKELIARCKFEWTSKGGVDGYLVTGPNGASIFLPLTGCMQGTKYTNKDRGYYLGSVLSSPIEAGSLWFMKKEECGFHGLSVAHGFPIRAVKDKR